MYKLHTVDCCFHCHRACKRFVSYTFRVYFTTLYEPLRCYRQPVNSRSMANICFNASSEKHMSHPLHGSVSRHKTSAQFLKIFRWNVGSACTVFIKRLISADYPTWSTSTFGEQWSAFSALYSPLCLELDLGFGGFQLKNSNHYTKDILDFR